MERNREARRGSMAAMNGGGHQRRRQRGSGLRDSPEDDAAIEMPETTRLRDRASKRDRERDRSSRSKRRRGERMMHGGVRDDGEESSEESVDDEDDEEEDDPSMTHRLPPPPPAAASSPAPSSSSASQNAHLRRSLPSAAGKPLRPPPPVWKVADEMIGVSVPRKARSASGKRSQDSWASGGGDPIHRQPSTSPARPSTASAAQVSPSSSNVSVRKKMMKPTAGATQRPPKSSKPSSAQEDIEFEVAEVLFGMTRQVHCTSKQEINKVDSKDATGSIGDGKSGASSPISQSSAQHQRDHFSNQGTTAPKRKRPRPVKFDDESPTSPLSSVALPATSTASTAKLEPEEQQPSKAEDSMAPRSEKMPSQATENGSSLSDLPVSHSKVAAIDSQQDLATKSEKNQDLDAKVLTGEADSSSQTPAERKEEAVSTQKAVSPPAVDVNVIESKNAKRNSDVASDKPKEEKFSIDLMAPPPGKLSPEREDYVPIHKPLDPQNESVSKLGDSRREEKIDTKPVSADSPLEGRKDKPVIEELNLKKQNGKERTLDLQLDLENSERDGKDPSQKQQQFKAIAKADPKPEKSVPPATSMPLPMPVSGWPGNLPPFGYMSQIPSLQPVLPMDASAGSSKPLQPINFLPPQRPKRCATHCYIAQTIRYHQQLAKMNPFWPAAASTMQLYGAKPYNLNALPPSESAAVLGNPLQGNLTGRNVASLQDKGSTPVIAGYMSNSTREKTSTVNSSLMEAAQRKQFMVQQAPQPASANNMLGPALIFPLNQHQAASAASTGRPPAPKTTSASGVAASSSGATGNTGIGSYGTGGPAPALNISYPSLPPNEAQYLAILQNNGYPFPVPAHVGTAPYRGAAPAQALPFYGGPFYSSQMIHPSQLQQQQAPQQPSHAQHGHQNTSTSSGSSSSQKQPKHSQRVPGGGPATAGGSSHSFPVSKQGQHLSETGCEESSLATDTRASQGQKSSHGHNFALPIHHQNFALISPAAAAAAALGGVGGNHNEKQQATQHPVIKMELTPSQAYAMSFASLTGAAAAAAAAGPQGIDFSALAQNHALFQSLPEGARHGYQMAAAVQAAQHHKKAHHQEDGKSVVEPMNSTAAIEEERKMMTSSKAPMSGSQQSLAFSRQDSETPISSILSNSVMDSSSRTLNLIPAVGNGGRTPIRTANATQTTAAATAAASSPNSQQQHLIQLQKQQQQHQQHQLQQHQQQIQLQHQLTSRAKTSASSNNAGVYSERMQAVSKFPQTLSGFPQTLIQSGGSPSQSPQWNASSRSAGNPVPSTAAPSSSGKSQLHQHQNRIPQQSPTSAHQTQISFGVNPLKMTVGPSGQSSMPSLSSSTSMVVGSFPNSVNKSSGGGSPQASLSGKSVPPVSTTLPLQHQASDKNSQSSSSLKPSPMSNRNMPSVLGHPHITPAPSSSSSSSSKQQQQQRQTQPQQKQPYPQAQFFFSNAYMPSQSAQSNASAAAAAAYYQRHQTELQSQQSQQHASNPMGVLSVCSSALTLSAPPATNDPTKAMAASAAAATAAANMKGLAAPGLLQHPSQPASAGSYPFISAAAAGFPYMHAMPTVSVKAPEQKPPAGNDSLNASWQPEKR